MDADVLRAVRGLLDSERVLTLAVVVDGAPVAALLPFATTPDYASLLVQASGLARHSRGLRDGASVGVVVHLPATADRDPMQIPRLAVQASVRVLPPDSQAFADAADRLVERFPAAAMTLALPDFRVCALDLERGRYVEGFARAVNVGPETFRALTS